MQVPLLTQIAGLYAKVKIGTLRDLVNCGVLLTAFGAVYLTLAAGRTDGQQIVRVASEQQNLCLITTRAVAEESHAWCRIYSGRAIHRSKK